jgi:hypothetical protein
MPTEEGNSYMQVEMYLKESGSETEPTAMDLTKVKKAESIEANGSMTSSMAMGRRSGPMVLSTRASILKA